jgi:putative ABC transport system permease protein
MFNLENAIQSWKRQLAKKGVLAEGKIAELESHLRDEVEEGIAGGCSAEEAFQIAVERVGRPEEIVRAFGLARLRGVGRTHWRLPWFVPALAINNLRLAFRRIKRQKGYSLINILSLAVGLAAAGLILHFIRFETSVDAYHRDVDRIFRVGLSNRSETGERVEAGNYALMASTLKDTFPQVEYAASVFNSRGWEPLPVRFQDRIFKETNIWTVSPGVFRILDIAFLRGNPAAALDRPNACVLSRRLAEKYFGGLDPMGQTIRINDRDFEVTGVVDDPPPNTQFQYDILCSWKTVADDEMFRDWRVGITAVMCLIKLKPGIDPVAFEKTIADVPHRFAGPELESLKVVQRNVLQPLRRLYLYEFTFNGLEPSQRLKYLYVLGIVAALILTLAGLNFVNLATARSIHRAGEIGIRKVAGASRKQLVIQFLGESLLLSGAALLIAWAAMAALLPVFNSLTGRTFAVPDIVRPDFIAACLVLTILLGFVSGLYPAFVLSSFRPGNVLKSRLRSGLKRARPRRILVVGQFAISIALVIGTLFVHRQVGYMRRQPLGFDKSQKMVVTLRDWRMITDNYETVKGEFSRIPGVLGVSAGSGVPGKGINQTFVYPTGEKATKGMGFRSLRCDSDFFSVFDLAFAAGRPFRKDISTDRHGALIINEEGVKAFGWVSADEAIGKPIGEDRIPVVGVVKDFHWWGLQRPIEPMVIRLSPDLFRYITLKVDVSNLPALTSRIKEVFERLFPGELFDTFFVDEAFDLQYASEAQIGRLFRVSTVVALFIACLGLFGLASFVAEQRTKEIGVRKVLGAAVPAIVRMLSAEFARWVLVANVIAWPVAFLAGRAWLQDFTVRMKIPWDIFVLAGGLALAVALATVGFQAVRAATADPVESLRYE